jgi:hypothetical protein
LFGEPVLESFVLDSSALKIGQRLCANENVKPILGPALAVMSSTADSGFKVTSSAKNVTAQHGFEALSPQEHVTN